MDLLNSKSIGRTLKERRLQLGYTQELAAEKSVLLITLEVNR